MTGNATNGKALTFAMALASTAALPPPVAYDSEEAAARAERARAEIAAELTGMPDHDWAGSYRVGGGNVGVTFDLAPGAGFLIELESCTGVYYRNYGAAYEWGGRVHLEPELPNEPGRPGNIDEELVPIQWGARRYLIAPRDFGYFCDAVNDGSEPRRRLSGTFLLRSGDETRPVEGLPRSPDGDLDCLLEKDIPAAAADAGPR